ncbi:hypothetical protein GGER_44690 [Serratia rubidaea]
MTEPIRPAAIARVLPHRYPFQLIDLVLSDPHEMAQGRVRALKNISANDTLLQGGALTAGRFPSVLLLEALAQAAGMLVHHRLTLLEAGQPCYFAAIRRAHFTRRPGRAIACIWMFVCCASAAIWCAFPAWRRWRGNVSAWLNLPAPADGRA